MDCSPPGSSVHGILQTRILDWVAISSSRGSCWPRDWTCISCIARRVLYHWATWEACKNLLPANWAANARGSPRGTLPGCHPCSGPTWTPLGSPPLPLDSTAVPCSPVLPDLTLVTSWHRGRVALPNAPHVVPLLPFRVNARVWHWTSACRMALIILSGALWLCFLLPAAAMPSPSPVSEAAKSSRPLQCHSLPWTPHPRKPQLTPCLLGSLLMPLDKILPAMAPSFLPCSIIVQYCIFSSFFLCLLSIIL